MPKLSSSLESVSSEELDDHYSHSQSSATDIPKARPEIWRDNCSQGREKHITPIELKDIVESIKRNQELEPIELPMPTPANNPSSPSATSASQKVSSIHLNDDSHIMQTSRNNTEDTSLATSRATLLESSASTVESQDDAASQTLGSESSSNTEMSTHSIIRGFTPGGAPSSYRSQTNLITQPTPILKTSPQYAQSKAAKKKGAMFTIGTSSGEDESSFESHMHKSQLSDHLRRPNSNLSGSSAKKQTSFKEEVAIGRAAAQDSPVFDESDDEDEEVSESAIEDDDDSSDWEDSDDQSGPSSVNEKEMFQRVDSRPNLTSRRSMLTTLMHEPDRAKALANAASRSTPHIRRSGRSTPNGPSVATLPEPGAQLLAHNTSTHARPIIVTTSNTHPAQLALSPRTTRRNMMSTELTESLRKNLLWERQPRHTGNLNAIKRRHTSNDVKNLRQHPEPAPVFSHQDGPKRFTNDYFHAGLQEYHAKGW